ncbi:MAG: hypothetical protein QOI47_2113 [Actinomycetota bacterium]|nr:hypothetical protein [Actinomycetota bacterium]
MTVRICSADQQGAYSFRCPTCTMAVTKAAEPRIVDLLVSSGVELQVWAPPAELRETRPGGDPFTHDDLLAFHDLLQEDGWLQRLCQDRG